MKNDYCVKTERKRLERGLEPEIEDIVIGALQGCSTRLRVQEVFSKFEIKDNSKKIKLLQQAMGNPETFYSRELSDEDTLQREISMFITHAWKLNDAYEKAGF